MSGERSRQFVDSNVLIYAHDRSAGDRHARARDLIYGLWESREGSVSAQVLQEFFVNLSRKVAVAEARGLAADYSAWRVHSPEAADVIEAIDIHRDLKISFWDAMIVRSASALDCDVLWTEDLNAGQRYRGVRAENPFA
jgi:predicted nucleic acid-binding protein